MPEAGGRLKAGAGIVASASFTPAAAAYSAADAISTAKEFVFTFADSGLAIPEGALIRIVSSVIKIDQTGVISGETSYSLPLHSVTPPSALADNAAYTLLSADLAAYSGLLSLGTPVDLGTACYVKTQYADQQDFLLASGKTSMFGYLVTAGAFTATAVARQISLYGFIV